jgi:hypothetical protein
MVVTFRLGLFRFPSISAAFIILLDCTQRHIDHDSPRWIIPNPNSLHTVCSSAMIPT